jgi:uncharacterized protein (TIGR02466 family)
VPIDDLRLLWATPIFVRRNTPPPAWTAGLERLIRARKAEDPGQQRSQYGGWQSSGDWLDSEAPEIVALESEIRQSILDCLASLIPAGAETSVRIGLTGVANVLPTGGYHTWHAHPGAHLAGTYCVNAGEVDPANPRSGTVCFYEPRAGGAMLHNRLLGFAEDFEVTQQTGTIILFPGFVGHSVHPYTGAGERIVVAFNAEVEEI